MNLGNTRSINLTRAAQSDGKRGSLVLSRRQDASWQDTDVLEAAIERKQRVMLPGMEEICGRFSEAESDSSEMLSVEKQ